MLTAYTLILMFIVAYALMVEGWFGACAQTGSAIAIIAT